jgi:hypothetical protein
MTKNTFEILSDKERLKDKQIRKERRCNKFKTRVKKICRFIVNRHGEMFLIALIVVYAYIINCCELGGLFEKWPKK